MQIYVKYCHRYLLCVVKNTVTGFAGGFAKKLGGLAGGLIGGKSYIIEGSTVNVIQKVAEGGFSVVYLVKHAKSGRTMALKRIICRGMCDEQKYFNFIA